MKTPPPPPPIPFVSKVKKVEKVEGAEVDKTEHIKLEFFMDLNQLPSTPETLLSSRGVPRGLDQVVDGLP